MKTFREMICWELEQEKKTARPLQITTEEAAGKIGSGILRKLRHLSNDAQEQINAAQPTVRYFC